MITVQGRFTFADGGNGTALLGSGWSAPELAWTWSNSHSARLNFPIRAGTGSVQIDLTLGVHPPSPSILHQTISIRAGSKIAIHESLAGETIISIYIARTWGTGHTNVELLFVMPSAVAPSDTGTGSDSRKLGIAISEAVVFDIPAPLAFSTVRRRAIASRPKLVQAVAGLPVRDMAMAFESLGTNCEFGLFQRRCGAEPTGLLRFAGIPYPQIVEGIDLGFEDIANPELLECSIHGAAPEWMVENKRYRMRYHTFRSPSEVSAEQIIREQVSVLGFKRQKFLDLLATGEKLFVIKRPEGLSVTQIMPLLTVLRSFGPNSLLFVGADTGMPAGAVEALAADLYRGSMDSVPIIADDDEIIGRDTWLSDAATATWMSICANAYRLWRDHRHLSLRI